MFVWKSPVAPVSDGVLLERYARDPLCMGSSTVGCKPNYVHLGRRNWVCDHATPFRGAGRAPITGASVRLHRLVAVLRDQQHYVITQTWLSELQFCQYRHSSRSAFCLRTTTELDTATPTSSTAAITEPVYRGHCHVTFHTSIASLDTRLFANACRGCRATAPQAPGEGSQLLRRDLGHRSDAESSH